MRNYLRDHIRMTNHVINMTEEPIRLYDDFTGEIVTFFPNVRRLVRDRWSSGLFPMAACYVFTPDMVEDIKWFQDCYRNIAVIAHKNIGHGGVEVVDLISADHINSVKFRKK